MASFVTPYKRSGMSPSTKPPQRPNIIRAFREREERLRAVAVPETIPVGLVNGPSRAGSNSLAVSTRLSCPNKECTRPNVIGGTCRTCGRVVDDSNIVAEVQFGETSSGAAVVQGSFLAAHQGGIRAVGPAFRRVGGSDERDRSIREARSLMTGYAQQLNLGESSVSAGVQAFKLASAANFIQGRTLATVAAVCLYAACRNEPPCKVMLIDLADLVQVNVFKLGRTFKKLNEVVPICNNGLLPVYPEDLIWRFASKLEFRHMTARVAEDAVRLVKRMSRDWIVMGRRPSGICGACLLMAARMHNFRRTVREVVYIVKVTSHTIQLRLEEFKATESSQMTVEDFLQQDFLESSHDPPSFRPKVADDDTQDSSGREKKRKRGKDAIDLTEIDEQDEDDSDGAGSPAVVNGDHQAGFKRVRSSYLSSPVLIVDPSLELCRLANEECSSPDRETDLLAIPSVEYRRDADGFIIPPIPAKMAATDPILLDAEGAEALEALARRHGDVYGASSLEDGGESAAAPSRGTAANARLPVTREWEADEVELEDQIEEMFNDPHTLEHALAYGNAEQRARIHTSSAMAVEQQSVPVSMAAEVDADEFANDPEVANCLLTPAEARIKETMWVNENREWLRAQQERVFRRKLLQDGSRNNSENADAAPRRRRHRPRIGEGQTSPASTPGEAAVAALRERAWSKRINYDAIRNLFDLPGRPGIGSAVASRRTSHAGSVIDDDEEEIQAVTRAPALPPSRPVRDQAEANHYEEEQDEDEEEEEEAEMGGDADPGGEFDGPVDFDDTAGYDEDGVGWDADDD